MFVLSYLCGVLTIRVAANSVPMTRAAIMPSIKMSLIKSIRDIWVLPVYLVSRGTRDPTIGNGLVLHYYSIYLIDIKCEPKPDYEQCLNQHWITSEIDIEWRNRQKSVWFLRYWITFWWNLCKNCSFCQFWGIFGGILGMFVLNQIYPKSNLREQISIRTSKAEIVQH